MVSQLNHCIYLHFLDSFQRVWRRRRCLCVHAPTIEVTHKQHHSTLSNPVMGKAYRYRPNFDELVCLVLYICTSVNLFKIRSEMCLESVKKKPSISRLFQKFAFHAGKITMNFIHLKRYEVVLFKIRHRRE